ncbi:MAG TPA: helix-turn-helix transcriptional regulator [Niastella sp.]
MSIKLNDLAKVKRVAAILKKEYKYHYTHQQLALKVGTNESQLRVAFKQVYKTTINTYLRDIRVTKAKELLENTQLPLHMVAAQTGFNDASVFIKNFKKSTGWTPVKWRKNGINNF